jgi:heat shock protein HslJ
MKKLLNLLLGATFLLGVASCNKTNSSATDTLPQGENTVLSIQGVTSTTQVKSASVTSTPTISLSITGKTGTIIGEATLTQAKIAVKEIQFSMPDSEIDNEAKQEQENEIEFKGPFIVDLITDSVTPELKPVALLPATYTGIKLKLDKIEGDETNEDDGSALATEKDSIYQHSIYLEGTYTGVIQRQKYENIPFTVKYDMDKEINFNTAGTNGFKVALDSMNTIIVAFNLDDWFNFSNGETNPDQVDFSDLTVQTDANGNPFIVIEKTDEQSDINAAVQEVIEHNLELSTRYGKDEDHDGHLGNKEDDDTANDNGE